MKPAPRPLLGRRRFLTLSGLAGAGLVLGSYLRLADDAFAIEVRSGAQAAPEGAALNAFVRIAPDGRAPRAWPSR